MFLLNRFYSMTCECKKALLADKNSKECTEMTYKIGILLILDFWEISLWIFMDFESIIENFKSITYIIYTLTKIKRN